MPETALLHIDYAITFADGSVTQVPIRLNAATLARVREPGPTPPDWTKLASIGCKACPLERTPEALCPVAVNLVDLCDRFATHFSYERISLKVTTAERVVCGETTLQAALCSLTGLVMVTAGCPIMDKLRPMARFHLPLATEEETIYRAASMYLVAQYLRAQAGQNADWELAGLEEIYQQVHAVNLAIARRLREAAIRDASANALVRLDLFADGVAQSIRARLPELNYLFGAIYGDHGQLAGNAKPPGSKP